MKNLNKYIVTFGILLSFLEINYGIYLWNDQSWKFLLLGGVTVVYTAFMAGDMI